MSDSPANDPTPVPRRPSGFLKWVFDAPSWLYEKGMGRALGKRILALTHVGRNSGRQYETVLEVVLFDRDTQESIVASAYGTDADWYRNIEAEPAKRIRTGRLDYVPMQRFLTPEEVKAAAARFCEEHPLESRLVPRVLPAIGAAIPTDSDLAPADLLASLPMVAFRPAH